MTELTDEALIQAIHAGGSRRQKAIRQIYGNTGLHHKIVSFVQQNNGNLQDGQDIFHEGIIVLDKNIRSGKFRGESTLTLYLYSICRFLWMNQIRKKSKVDLQGDHQRMDDIAPDNPAIQLEDQERKEMIRKVLGQLGERCQKILELWKLSYSMEEIATELEFSSAAMARKNKYRCHQSLVKLLQTHPQWTNLIKS